MTYCPNCTDACPGCLCLRCNQCAELDSRWEPAFIDNDVEERPATTTEVVNVKGGRL